MVDLKMAWPTIKINYDKKIKGKNAAGKNGCTKEDLNRIGMAPLLSKLYNLLLSVGYFPKCWRANRMALILKEGKDTKAENWRPITISSHLVRIFMSLIDARLKNCIHLCPA